MTMWRADVSVRCHWSSRGALSPMSIWRRIWRKRRYAIDGRHITVAVTLKTFTTCAISAYSLKGLQWRRTVWKESSQRRSSLDLGRFTKKKHASTTILSFFSTYVQAPRRWMFDRIKMDSFLQWSPLFFLYFKIGLKGIGWETVLWVQWPELS